MARIAQHYADVRRNASNILDNSGNWLTTSGCIGIIVDLISKYLENTYSFF